MSADDDPISVASLYLAALIDHEADRVPFAEGVRRVNNGRLAAEGADELRTILRREPVARTGPLRWIVDGEHAIVFYGLEADLARGKGAIVSPPDEWMPARIGERFLVRDGRIEEIEVVFAPNTPRSPGNHAAFGGSRSGSRDETLQAAQAYVAAVVTRDASAVPIHESAWRIENARDTGRSGAAICASLEAPDSPIRASRDALWFASGDAAAGFYTLDLEIDGRPAAIRVAERFAAIDGKLSEIEVVFSPPIG